MTELQTLASEYSVRNESTSQLLLAILALFEGQGIPAIPFKGVTFALANYPSLNLRQCGDIDLLVRRQDFLAAKALMIRDGFDEVYFGHHESATVQAQLVRNDGKEAVDLHYGITPHFYPDMSEAEQGSRLNEENWNQRINHLTYWHFYLDPDPLWTRTVPLNVAGKTISVFSPEDSLIVASVQGVKDLWLSLRRICDIAEMLRANPSLDWDLVFSRVRALNFEKKFHLGIQLAHGLLGAPLDERILRDVHKYSIVEGVAAHTQTMLFRTYDESDRLGFRMSSNILTMDTFRDRFRYLRFADLRFRNGSHPRMTLRRYRAFLHMLTMPYIFLLRRGVP